MRNSIKLIKVISRKIAIRTAQLKDNKTVLDQVKGDIKLTLPIKIPPYQTITISGMTNVTAHTKCVNIVTEPGENNNYTVPCFSHMRPSSKRASIALQNLTSKSIELKKGTVVAQVQAANAIPPMLVNKNDNTNNNADDLDTNLKPTKERIEKLLSKVDLSGADEWSEDNKQKLRSLDHCLLNTMVSSHWRILN